MLLCDKIQVRMEVNVDKNRISVNIESHDHKLLKSYCASIGITIKEFVLNAVLHQLEEKLKEKEFQNGLKRRTNSSRSGSGSDSL